MINMRFEDVSEEDMEFVVEAEDSEGFQEYQYADGRRVPSGTPIGIEKVDNGVETLTLFDDIFYSENPTNDMSAKFEVWKDGKAINIHDKYEDAVAYILEVTGYKIKEVRE